MLLLLLFVVVVAVVVVVVLTFSKLESYSQLDPSGD